MDQKHPVKEDGVIMRGRSYVIGGVAVAALWLHVPPLPGVVPEPEHQPSSPRQQSGPPAQSSSVTCDRTLSPRGPVTIARVVHARKRIRTLCLHGGVYRTGEVYLRRRGMTITSVPGERATWRGRIIVRASGVTLERLTLDGTRRGRHSLPNPTINGAGFTLRDSDVTNRNGICVQPGDYKGLTARGFTIERNRIHDCGRRPPTNHDHGIYVSSGTGVVRWNAIFDNADRGIQLYPAARGVRVYGNTIDGNGEGIIFADAAARNVATNNLITNSRIRWNVEYFDLRGRGNEVLSNCVMAGASESYYRHRGGIIPGIERYVKLEGNAAGEVQYADRAHHDLRPTSVSAFCAGMGAPDDVTAPPGG
jgi:parallel beta-helix repeat protein